MCGILDKLIEVEWPHHYVLSARKFFLSVFFERSLLSPQSFTKNEMNTWIVTTNGKTPTVDSKKKRFRTLSVTSNQFISDFELITVHFLLFVWKRASLPSYSIFLIDAVDILPTFLFSSSFFIFKYLAMQYGNYDLKYNG